MAVHYQDRSKLDSTLWLRRLVGARSVSLLIELTWRLRGAIGPKG